MADPKDRGRDDGKTTLGREASEWLSGRDGYSSKDAARDTGVSEKEAQDAHDQAAKDNESTN